MNFSRQSTTVDPTRLTGVPLIPGRVLGRRKADEDQRHISLQDLGHGSVQVLPEGFAELVVGEGPALSTRQIQFFRGSFQTDEEREPSVAVLETLLPLADHLTLRERRRERKERTTKNKS